VFIDEPERYRTELGISSKFVDDPLQITSKLGIIVQEPNQVPAHGLESKIAASRDPEVLFGAQVLERVLFDGFSPIAENRDIGRRSCRTERGNCTLERCWSPTSGQHDPNEFLGDHMIQSNGPEGT
jgi:hypothetical protein